MKYGYFWNQVTFFKSVLYQKIKVNRFNRSQFPSVLHIVFTLHNQSPVNTNARLIWIWGKGCFKRCGHNLQSCKLEIMYTVKCKYLFLKFRIISISHYLKTQHTLTEKLLEQNTLSNVQWLLTNHNFYKRCTHNSLDLLLCSKLLPSARIHLGNDYQICVQQVSGLTRYQDSILLGYDTVSMCNHIQMLWCNVASSYT